jgi:hypothetical protein
VLGLTCRAGLGIARQNPTGENLRQIERVEEPVANEEGSMNAFARILLVLLMTALPTGKLLAQATPPHPVSVEEYERWKKDLSNWGRWGKDDQIGALNLITPEKRKQAAGLVKEGSQFPWRATPTPCRRSIMPIHMR